MDRSDSRRELVTGRAFSRYEQFDTSPETIEQELRPALSLITATDRFKNNYSIEYITCLVQAGIAHQPAACKPCSTIPRLSNIMPVPVHTVPRFIRLVLGSCYAVHINALSIRLKCTSKSTTCKSTSRLNVRLCSSRLTTAIKRGIIT